MASSNSLFYIRIGRRKEIHVGIHAALCAGGRAFFPWHYFSDWHLFSYFALRRRSPVSIFRQARRRSNPCDCRRIFPSSDRRFVREQRRGFAGRRREGFLWNRFSHFLPSRPCSHSRRSCSQEPTSSPHR